MRFYEFITIKKDSFKIFCLHHHFTWEYCHGVYRLRYNLR